MHPTPNTQPAPAGLDAECRYLDDVLAFQAANGGPFPRSLELRYAVCRLARAWGRAGIPERVLGAWLAVAAAGAVGEGVGRAALTRELQAWAADELPPVAASPPRRTTGSADAA